MGGMLRTRAGSAEREGGVREKKDVWDVKKGEIQAGGWATTQAPQGTTFHTLHSLSKHCWSSVLNTMLSARPTLGNKMDKCWPSWAHSPEATLGQPSAGCRLLLSVQPTLF